MTILVAVTACPTGVAHTYMAAEALLIAAKKKSGQLKSKPKVPQELKMNSLLILKKQISLF